MFEMQSYLTEMPICCDISAREEICYKTVEMGYENNSQRWCHFFEIKIIFLVFWKAVNLAFV